jgi:ATP-dependent RNA helicase DDX35
MLPPPPSKKSRWDKQEKVPKSDAVMVRLEGRSFPVEIAYLQEPTADVVLKVVETVFDIHLKVCCAYCIAQKFLGLSLHLQYPAGDILVFLTGREEIDRCLQQLADNMVR